MSPIVIERSGPRDAPTESQPNQRKYCVASPHGRRYFGCGVQSFRTVEPPLTLPPMATPQLLAWTEA